MYLAFEVCKGQFNTIFYCDCFKFLNLLKTVDSKLFTTIHAIYCVLLFSEFENTALWDKLSSPFFKQQFL